MAPARSLTVAVSYATWERYQTAVEELTGAGLSVMQSRRSVTDACLALGAVSPLASDLPAPVKARHGLPVRVERTAVADAAFLRFRLAGSEEQRAYATWAIEAHVRQAVRFWLSVGEEDRQAVFRVVGLARVLAL